MNKTFLILTVLLLPNFAAASANLEAIANSEWKGACRKYVNEAGEEIPHKDFKRLQSSYSYSGGKLLWWVKSFKDEKCTQIFDANKYTLECGAAGKNGYASCKQIAWHSSKDGRAWMPTDLVDKSGISDAVLFEAKVVGDRSKKVTLFTVSESDEGPEAEILVR